MIKGHLKCFSRERMHGVMNLCLSDRICKIFLVYLKVYGYTFSFMINTQISDRTRPLFASDKDQSQTYLTFVQEHYKKHIRRCYFWICARRLTADEESCDTKGDSFGWKECDGRTMPADVWKTLWMAERRSDRAVTDALPGALPAARPPPDRGSTMPRDSIT